MKNPAANPDEESGAEDAESESQSVAQKDVELQDSKSVQCEEEKVQETMQKILEKQEEKELEQELAAIASDA